MIAFTRAIARWRRILFVFAIAALAAAAACDDEPTGVSHDGIRIVAAPQRTDTIGATPVQALVVDVAGADDGAVVRFEAIAVLGPCWYDSSQTCDWPSMLVGPLSGTYMNVVYVDSTNADGRAMAQVAFGNIAGEAGIVVVVPELGLTDTIEFTVLPGQPALIRPADFDSLLILGQTETISFVATDRASNPLDAALTLNALDPDRVALANGRAVAAGVGAGRIEATLGGLTDTLRVLVYPPDTVTVQDGSGAIRRMMLDGTMVSTLTVPAGFSHAGPERDPRAARWFYFISNNDYERPWSLRVLQSSGLSQPVGALAEFEWSSWPEFSADGEWLYFDGRRSAGACVGIWRINRTLTQVDSVLTLTDVSLRMPRPAPDGARVAAATGGCSGGETDGDVRVLHPATGEMQPFEGNYFAYAWSPSSDRLALATEERTDVIILADQQVVGSWNLGADYGTLEWAPDLDFLLSGNRYQTPVLIDLDRNDRIPTGLPQVIGLDWIRTAAAP